MSPVPPPSGRQYTISCGTQQATIVEVGGGIRTYSVEDRDVLDPYPTDRVVDGAHGTPLVPWPNRLGDGATASTTPSTSFRSPNPSWAMRSTACCAGEHGVRWRSRDTGS